jgi:Mak10 subunit, NatC N(alpha)-terminal acetyltransferase
MVESYVDITEEIRKAASSLPIGGMIHAESFSLESAMHAIEIGDPKLDIGMHSKALSPDEIFETHQDALLFNLNAKTVLSIVDSLLLLESSWLRGNTLPQTVFTNFYLQPRMIQTLRQISELPLWMSQLQRDPLDLASTEHFNDLSYSSFPLKKNCSESVKVWAKVLVSYITSLLYSMCFTHLAVLEGELFEEDDYYGNLFGCLDWASHCLGIFLGRAANLQSIQNTFTAKSIPKVHKSESSFNEVVDLLSAAEVALGNLLSGKEGGILASEEEAVLRGCISRLQFRSGYAKCHYYLSNPLTRAPAPVPLRWGHGIDLEKLAGAVTTTIEAFVNLANGPVGISFDSSLSSGSDPSSALALCHLRGLDNLYLGGHAPRFVPLSSFSSALTFFRDHLLQLFRLSQLPKLVSYDPFIEFDPGNNPAFAALKSHANLIAAMPALPPVSTSSLTKALDVKELLLPLPPSGLLDELVSVVPDEVAAELQNYPLKGTYSITPRLHTSLFALIQALEDFSELNGDILVRSWGFVMTLQAPAPGALSAEREAAFQRARERASARKGPDNASEEAAPAVVDEYDCIDEAPAWSAVVFGRVSLLDCLKASMLSVGVAPELLASQEGARFATMLGRVLENQLKAAFGSRLRLRRRADVLLRDWSIVTVEADVVDVMLREHLDRKLKVIESYLVLGPYEKAKSVFLADSDANGSIVQSAGVSTDDPVLIRLKEMSLLPSSSSQNQKDHSSVYAGHPVGLEKQHLHLVQLRSLCQHSRLFFWTGYVASKFMVQVTKIGLEDSLFHSDEMGSAYYYLDYLMQYQSQMLTYLKTSRRAKLVHALPDSFSAPSSTGDLYFGSISSTPSPRLVLEDASESKVHEATVSLALAALTEDESSDKDTSALVAPGAKAAASSKKKSKPLAALKQACQARRAAVQTHVRSLISPLNRVLLELQRPLQDASGSSGQFGTVPFFSAETDLLQAESHLSRGILRTLSAMRVLGVWRGLEALNQENETNFRDATIAFRARWRFFSSFHSPAPPKLEDYLRAEGCTPTRSGVVNFLLESKNLLSLAQQYATRVVSHCKFLSAVPTGDVSAKKGHNLGVIGPSASPQAFPVSSFSILAAQRLISRAQKLLKTILSNVVFVTKVINSESPILRELPELPAEVTEKYAHENLRDPATFAAFNALVKGALEKLPKRKLVPATERIQFDLSSDKVFAVLSLPNLN